MLSSVMCVLLSAALLTPGPASIMCTVGTLSTLLPHVPLMSADTHSGTAVLWGFSERGVWFSISWHEYFPSIACWVIMLQNCSLVFEVQFLTVFCILPGGHGDC